MSQFAAAPSLKPTRAVAGLLLNLIVLPGLGTLVSGDPKRRRIGWVQLGLGVLLLPLIAILATTTWTPSGTSPESVRNWVGNVMMALGFWSAITSFLIIWDAWKAERRPKAGA